MTTADERLRIAAVPRNIGDDMKFMGTPLTELILLFGVPLFVWVLLGAVSAAFSAGCFVVLAVTLAERRLAGQARSLRKLMTDRR